MVSSRASSDCIVLETLSTLAKALDVIVLDSTIANPAYIESRKKKCYKLNRHFQDSWATKCPWVKLVMGVGGRITQVR